MPKLWKECSERGPWIEGRARGRGLHGAIMTSAAAEIKKPPLAPKPKIVGANNRSAPPPVAPKPDTVIVSALQRIKKPKPTIAPKPKVLKSSLVNDIGQPPSRRITVHLEEQKPELSDSRDTFSCKNVEVQLGSNSVLPEYSCSSEYAKKPGSRNNVYVKQLVLEPLKMKEKSENSELNKPSLAVQSRNKWDSCENCRSFSEVLKASTLGEKFHDVSTQQTLTCSSPEKHISTDNPEMNGGHSSNIQCRTECSNLSPSLSSLEKVPASQNCHPQLPGEEFQNSKTCQDDSEKSNSCFHPSELDAPENDKRNDFLSKDVVNSKTEVQDFPPLEISLVPYTPRFPTPKPRKNFSARLLRQKCIDTPSESTEKAEDSNNSSSSCTVNNLKSNKVSFLHQKVVTIQKQANKEKPENKSELHSDSSSDSPDLIDSQKAMRHETSSSGKMAPSFDTDSNVPGDFRRVDGSSMSLPVDKGTDLVRCSALSLSLPKQVELKCTEPLPAPCDPGVTVSQLQKGSITKEESSSRVVPKKPQRHSLPAAGVLKKAASEELVEKSSYPSNREKNLEKSLESNHLQHLGAQNHGMSSSSFDMPEQYSEKPVWKLPHPILPFFGNPESLKSIIVSSNTEPSVSPTKPRAKSLSAVDTIKCTKPGKESPKKNSLKKLLNIKLSISFSKSDIQKFWSKNSQFRDGFPSSLSDVEQKGIESDWHGFLVREKKRSKPTKAYSADNYSPESRKKKRPWNQTGVANGLRAESLDDQILSRDSSHQVSSKSVISGSAPEYENVRYYEEIPEYENFPFIMAMRNSLELELQKSSSVEDPDANVYEIEELYEAADGQVQLGSRPQHSRSSGSSQEVQDDLDIGLGDMPSEEEEVINSSDEDDVSSESSKGELDLLEDKQDFRDAVAHASRQLGKPVIEDRILNQILYYLPQLYELNRDLLKELEERLLNWTEQQRIADIFVKKGPYLKMYSTYIKEFDRNLALLDEQCKKNSGFAAVVREFEMSPRCANLALKHYLLKPVQRIPQYRLLLTDYLNNLLEDSGDYRDTQDALAVVIEVANHANDTMKQGDNFQKLMQIQYSLNGHHEIVQPGRVFLKEGILMKLSRKVMQPRMFFLFNDALLYTTPMQSGIYKLNNMLSLAGMKVRKPTQEGYQNELKIESVERSFILSASSATERDEWLEAISRSIEEYAKKKITFCPTKSLDEADSENKEEASPLGSKAPIWIPDTRATMCMICTSEFTLTWRRHHCRACGKIVCQACSSYKYGLDYLKNQLARVCEHCFQELQKLGHQHSPGIGSLGNHKSPSNALSSVLLSIPPGRRQKKIPAALKEVSANTEDSSMSGYLYRSKGNKKTWKHLWFVIKNKVLYTYAASEDVAALESQPLLGFTVSQVKGENSESKVFQLLHKNMLFYVFKADDAHSAQKWIEAFQEGTIL
ncbi:FYVE, RhoGEF and PH domain-containing protein 6 isoform X2 [Perognathus longimembris pacificus]|uniref:FYVE, RhoGEF and PH domain-containing protein 6 isoform X2 n=1 Tax=Perognathus longimembris pacificus TaxID=214514 RepID=UPI002018F49D|nr:FYVE, RhoGEF and PH domain-containing protein 6 isoform X2 [Perognathus longimembris pacificus]